MMRSAYNAFLKTSVMALPIVLVSSSSSLHHIDNGAMWDGGQASDDTMGVLTEIAISPTDRPIMNVSRIEGDDGDQRVPVFNTDVDYNGIGMVNGICTGTLIGDRRVLTSAHCFDTHEGETYFNIVHTTINGDEDRFHFRAESIWMHPNYIPSDNNIIAIENIQYDMAVIILEDDVPEMFNRFNVASMPLESVEPIYAEVLGYPADLGSILTIQYNVGAIFMPNNSMIISDYDQAQGASGGAMFYNNQIIGLNSGLNEDSQRSYHTPVSQVVIDAFTPP